jgi:hypothetical protein
VFVVSVAAGLLAAAALAFGPARKDRDVRNAAAFTVLVLVSVLIAGLRRPVAFAGRTEMAVLPVWLWGVAVAARGNPFARAAAAATAVVGATATVFMVASPRPVSAPLVAAERLSRATRKGDIVVAATGFYLPARLAAERGRLAARVVPLPSELSDHPGWFEPTFPGAPEEKVVAEAVASLPPGGAIFFAVPAVYATPRLFAPLGPEPQLRPLMQQPGALVAAWSR